jgi:heme exporter protein B
MVLSEIRTLLWKEFLLEWRQKYAINGMLLYLASTILVCYMSFNLKPNQLNVLTWNALFWIILLFTAVNAVAKSFLQERYGRMFYYYSLVSPQSVILSKTIYNLVLMLILALLGYAVYATVLGNPVQDKLYFLISIVLGAIGFSIIFTMISAIASKAQNSNMLMAVLGFPIIIPVMVMVLKISKSAIDGLDRSLSTDEVFVLLAINIMIATVAYILFPYLWRS